MFNPNDKPEPPKAQATSARPRKVYLGDGAYVEFDGYGFRLTAENGIEATDTIVLEPAVFVMLREFVHGIYPELASSRSDLLAAVKAWLKAADHDSRAYSFAEMEAFDLMEKAVARAEGRS